MLAVTAYRRNNQTGNFLIINQIFQNPFFCFQIVKGQVKGYGVSLCFPQLGQNGKDSGKKRAADSGNYHGDNRCGPLLERGVNSGFTYRVPLIT